MSRRPTQRSTIKTNTVRDMRTLGTYKKEYDPLIDIYCDLLSQYMSALKEFEVTGSEYEIETERGGMKKSPIVATLEVLRKDILQYSDRLCLNPKANQDEPSENKQSKLSLALKNIG